MIGELPKEIVLYGIRYELAGHSIVSRKHITAVIIWRGELYFYDGLEVTGQVRLKPLDKKNLIHKGVIYVTPGVGVYICTLEACMRLPKVTSR